MRTAPSRVRSYLILLLAAPVAAIGAVPTLTIHAPEHPLANALGYVLVERGFEHRVTESGASLLAADRGGALPPDYPGWPLTRPGEWTSRHGSYLVQADADPAFEILWQSGKESRRVHLVDTNGTPMPGWPKFLSPGIRSKSGCAFGDVDGDGIGEVIALSDNSPSYTRGWTWAWRVDGTLMPGFPFQTNGDFWGPPTVDDLDGDGKAEIVVDELRWPVGALYVINQNGQPLPGWPVQVGELPASSVATADLDGDGTREIVCELANSLHVFRIDGTPWRDFLSLSVRMNSFPSRHRQLRISTETDLSTSSWATTVWCPRMVVSTFWIATATCCRDGRNRPPIGCSHRQPWQTWTVTATWRSWLEIRSLAAP